MSSTNPRKASLCIRLYESCDAAVAALDWFMEQTATGDAAAARWSAVKSSSR
jgi:hypothetical protein